MATYRFKCVFHDPPIVIDITRPLGDTLPPPCPAVPACDQYMQRVYTPPHIRPSMPAHFNHAVGQYVTRPSDIDSALARKSDVDAARLGMPVHYERVDPADQADVFKVTEQGMDDTRRQSRDAGVTPAPPTTIL